MWLYLSQVLFKRMLPDGAPAKARSQTKRFLVALFLLLLGSVVQGAGIKADGLIEEVVVEAHPLSQEAWPSLLRPSLEPPLSGLRKVRSAIPLGTYLG